MTRTFSVKNFEKFQHYKDRRPPWIKFHNPVLRDYEFGQLSDTAKWHLVGIWSLASQHDNKLPCDSAWIGQQIGAKEQVDIDALAEAGWLVMQDAIKPLARRKQISMPETETQDQSEKEPPNPRKRGGLSAEQSSEFEGWYALYPHKVGRGAAERAWPAARALASVAELSEGVARYVAAKRPDVAWCNPATWLNAKRWMDAPAVSTPPAAEQAKADLSQADKDARRARWAGRLGEYRDTGLWQTAWGAEPWSGNNGCLVPLDMRDAFTAAWKARQDTFSLPSNLVRPPAASDDAASLAARYEELIERRTG